MKYSFVRLLFVCLLSVAPGSIVSRAQVNAARPISGALGKVVAVATDSLDVQTKDGVVHVKIEQPLTTYKQVPSI
jgi:hypothetical protein